MASSDTSSVLLRMQNEEKRSLAPELSSRQSKNKKKTVPIKRIKLMIFSFDLNRMEVS
jgi:hypothetical protein